MKTRIALPLTLLAGCTAGFLLGRLGPASPPPAPSSSSENATLSSDLVEAASAPAQGDQLWLVPGDAPRALRPLAPASPAEAAALSLVYDWVYYRDADGLWKSRVIEDGSRDGDQVVLTLRSDLRWHDGAKVTAVDLCTSLSARAMQTALPAPSRCFKRDEHRAELTIPELDADWRLALATPLVPAHVDGLLDDALVDAHVLPVGSGPYTARVGRRGIRFEAAPSAHHTPGPQRIDLQSGGDPLVAVKTLANGHADVVLGAPAAWQGDLDEAGAVVRDGGALGRVAWADAGQARALSPDAAFADVVERPDGT